MQRGRNSPLVFSTSLPLARDAGWNLESSATSASQRRKAVILLVGPDVLDFYIAAFDESRLAETFQERRDHGCIIARRRTAEQTDHRHRLLRSCSKRPCDYRSTKRCDEIAPPHVRYPISDSLAVQAGTMEVLAEVRSRSVATRNGSPALCPFCSR
jgi:hypothetical protein